MLGFLYLSLVQAIEHEPPLLLPEYAGQGGDDYEGSYEEGSEEEEEGSDEELENEMEAALHEGALTSVAKVGQGSSAVRKMFRLHFVMSVMLRCLPILTWKEACFVKTAI